MAAFDSAGAGFSRGFATGSQIGLQQRQLQQQRAEQFMENLNTGIEQTNVAFDKSLEILGKVLPIADPGDPNVQAMISGAMGPVKLQAQAVGELRRQAEAAGMPAEVVAAMPSEEQIIANFSSRLQNTVLGAFFESPENMGEVEARRAIAKAEATIGRPLRAEELEELGLGRAVTPNVQNFINPDTGAIVGIDVTGADAQTQVRSLLQRGYVRTSLALQTDDPGAFSLTAPESRDITRQEISARNLLDETARLRQQLGDKDLRTGFTGGLLTGLNTIADQWKQFSVSFDLADEDILDITGYDFSKWGDEASMSAAFRRNILNTSFMLARAADPNDRLAAQEVQIQIDSLAAQAARTTMPAVLDEIDRATLQQLENSFQVMGRKAPEIGTFPSDLKEHLDKLTEVGGDGEPLEAGVKVLFDKAVGSGIASLTEQELNALSDQELSDLRRALKAAGLIEE